MDLESVTLSEISQVENDNAIWLHLFVESNEQNKQTEKKQTHRYREQTDSYQMGVRLGVWVKELSNKQTNKLIHADNSMVITRRKGVGGRNERV